MGAWSRSIRIKASDKWDKRAKPPADQSWTNE